MADDDDDGAGVGGEGVVASGLTRLGVCGEDVEGFCELTMTGDCCVSVVSMGSCPAGRSPPAAITDEPPAC